MMRRSLELSKERGDQRAWQLLLRHRPHPQSRGDLVQAESPPRSLALDEKLGASTAWPTVLQLGLISRRLGDLTKRGMLRARSGTG